MITAIACSAAAGKNPWLPLALIFLLAAPDSVPALLMNADLHRQLHDLLPVEALWSLGAVFGVLALADSLADKVSFIEKWLVPVSTAWRPFAGMACATIIGVAAAQGAVEPEEIEAVRAALTATHDASILVGGSIVALTVGLAAVYGWIATVSKTGTRLLLTMVPIPGLRFAHSLFDDFFALGATMAGLVFPHTAVVVGLLAAYLLLGLITAPVLTRLAWIHARIGWGLVTKSWRHVDEAPIATTRPPAWLARWLEAEGLIARGTAEAYRSSAGPGAPLFLPAYVYRAPELGFCRAGWLVLAGGKTAFVTRIWWRPRAYTLDAATAARVGLAETATARVVTLVERLASGGLREVRVNLYPARELDVLPVLEAGVASAGLARVRSESDSARAGLPGYADRGRSVRFLPAEEAGSLRLQGLVTISMAIGVGVLTAGVFVPIGAGYLLSPMRSRAIIGLLASGYLALCVFGSMGLAWPAAVLYATVLNTIALRDLTRHALKARVDGFVDRRAFLPLVAGRVWVPQESVRSAADLADESAEATPIDGSWRSVVALLADEPGPEAVAA